MADTQAALRVTDRPTVSRLPLAEVDRLPWPVTDKSWGEPVYLHGGVEEGAVLKGWALTSHRGL